jgi:hypothetical protein
MSKRSRGQMMVKSLRARDETPSSSTPQKSGRGKVKADIKSPIKQLLESPGVKKLMEEATTSSAIAEEVSRLSSCFKTLNSIVSTFHKRRKQSSWESVTESFETISPGSINVDDLATILTIWSEAFTVRWQAKTFDSQQNPRSFEMLVEVPTLLPSSLPTSPARTVTTASTSSTMDIDDGTAPVQLSATAIMTQRVELFK